MFPACFPKTETIATQARLREAFGTDAIYLAAGGRLVASGDIALGPGVVFEGACTLKGPLHIEQGCKLTDVTLGAGTKVRAHSVLSTVRAGANNLFGPFCFIRDECTVGDDCILGAHVEAARSSFASGVKVSHRAFIGDATVGTDVIIGAGVVFCNYLDGKSRRLTTVGAKAMIGSGTMLVAPLSVGDGAVVGAGSVVTKDVAAGVRVVQKRV